MNLEQATGQKLMLSFSGTTPPAELLETLRRQHVGGVTLFRHYNAGTPAEIRVLVAALQCAAAESGQPPLLIAADQEGGQLVAIAGTTPFPGNMALGATGSVELAWQAGRSLGLELAAIGVNVNYAPDCDVNVNPANPVIGVRSFGEDPGAAAQLAAAMVAGMQSVGVAATAKHFPGHGDVEGDTHHGLVVVPHERDRLQAVELPPFVAAIEAGAKLVMTAHVAVPAYDDAPLPATLSRPLLHDLLRGELGFEGVVISDALNMGAITQGSGQIIDILAATAAGVDLLLLMEDDAASRQIHAALVQAARRRLLDMPELVASAQRVLALKQWAAEFVQPPLDVIGSAEHLALAREIAEHSVTLVRDNARLLPLRLSPDARIAVIVPELRDLTPADTSSYETCGLADAVRQFHPNTESLVVPADPTTEEIAAITKACQTSNLVIVGTVNAFAQRGQAALVEALLATGLPTVVAALRMPYDLANFPAAPTFACTYSVQQPSMEALAAALFGRIAWQGRLPVSIPGLYPLGHGV